MIELKVKWDNKNVWEFVKYNSMNKIKGFKIFFIVFLVCFILLASACIAAYIIFQEIMMLLSAVLLFVIVGVYLLIFIGMLKKYAKQILKANDDKETNSVTITDDFIIVSQNDIPIGKMQWESVVSIDRNDKKDSAYIMTDKNALLLIEYNNITEGTKEELLQLLERKNGELSKKAG